MVAVDTSVIVQGESHEPQVLPAYRVRDRSLAGTERRSCRHSVAEDRLQRLAGLGGLAGRDRQRLAQGSRRRCELRMVRLLGVDGCFYGGAKITPAGGRRPTPRFWGPRRRKRPCYG